MMGVESSSSASSPSSSMLLRRSTRNKEDVTALTDEATASPMKAPVTDEPKARVTDYEPTNSPTPETTSFKPTTSTQDSTIALPQPTTEMKLSPETSPVIPEYQYYPVKYASWKACIAAKPYPANVTLYPDVCACCKKHECSMDMRHCEGMSAPVATPTPTTAIATAASPEHQFYPVQYGGFGVCIAAKPYPANVTLYADDCACCKKHGCDSDMSHCGEISTPVATPTPPAEIITASPTSVTTPDITTAATSEYQFYPVQYGDFRVCIAAKPYPANVTVYADDCACCKKHGCDSDMSHCGEISTPVTTPTPPAGILTASPTSVTTPDITTAATSEYQFYPVQYGDFRVCIAAKPYPTNIELYPDECACCKKHKCSSDTGHHHCGEMSTHVAITTSPTTATTTVITSPETDYPSSSPSEEPTIVSPQPTVKITISPERTKVPSISLSDSPSTSPSTSMRPTSDKPSSELTATPTTSKSTESPTSKLTSEPTESPTSKPTSAFIKQHYYPAKFGNETWCMYGDLLDPFFMQHMPPANDDLYTTMCECCSNDDYLCHTNIEAECGPKKGETDVPSKSPTMPQMWLYYPVKFGSDTYCVYGDHNDATFLTRMPPASIETYKTKCECCSKDHHICLDSVKKDCAAFVTEAPTSSPMVVIVDPTTINPTNGETVTGTPTSIAPVTDSPSASPSRAPVTESPSASPSKAPVTESPSTSPINPSPSKSPSNEPALTASPSKEPKTLISGYYFYPAHFGDNTFCLRGHSAMIPALVGLTPAEQVDYVSTTICECCTKNVCAMAPDTCPTALTKTTTTTTTAATTITTTAATVATTTATTAATSNEETKTTTTSTVPMIPIIATLPYVSTDDDAILFPYEVVKTVDNLQYIPEKKQEGDAGLVWPEKSLVGHTGEDAKLAILEVEPTLSVQILPEDTMMSMDYRSSRVRIYVDVNGKVVRQPTVG